MNDVRLHDLGDRRNGSGDLEARLRRMTSDLAGDVVAPPFDDVRHAIGRRSRALRRRRHVRRVAAGGVLAVAAAVAAVALPPVRPDVRVDPAGDGTGIGSGGGSGDPVAALTLDLAGWTMARAEEHDDVADMLAAGADGDPSTVVQLFRVQGRLAGPVVYIEHSFATDTVAPASGDEQVDIDGATGWVSETNGSVQLRWNPSWTDSEAKLTALGLDESEVLTFARSLDPVGAGESGDPGTEAEDDAAEDAGADATAGSAGADRLGFAATTAPRGIEEVGLPADARSPVDVRQAWFVDDAGGAGGAGEGGEGGGAGTTVEIRVDNRGERAFEMDLYDPTMFTVWAAPEQVTVLGRPALLRHDAASGRWILQWRHDEDAWVTVTISSDTDTGTETGTGAVGDGPDRAVVDDVVAHIRELPEAGWRAAVASTAAAAAGAG